jgi:hypothetical protein
MGASEPPWPSRPFARDQERQHDVACLPVAISTAVAYKYTELTVEFFRFPCFAIAAAASSAARRCRRQASTGHANCTNRIASSSRIS